MSSSLSREELIRYDRQIRVLGVEGQEKLRRSRVLVVGAGGLGSPVLYYLAAAGVGEIVIVDPEDVELSNLNRQIIHFTSDIGLSKVESAEKKIKMLNPHTRVVAVKKRLDGELAEELVPNATVVIDALDNWETRMMLNRVCVKYRRPLIHAGVREWYGQLLVVIPGKGPCLSCVFPKRIREEKPSPILGPIPGVLGTLQALEAIKVITGLGSPAVGRLLLFNGKTLEFTEVKVKRSPSCPVCSGI